LIIAGIVKIAQSCTDRVIYFLILDEQFYMSTVQEKIAVRIRLGDSHISGRKVVVFFTGIAIAIIPLLRIIAGSQYHDSTEE
jgi:hypothetical protein